LKVWKSKNQAQGLIIQIFEGPEVKKSGSRLTIQIFEGMEIMILDSGVKNSDTYKPENLQKS
jgi:hypothetical protein